jgi:Ca2+-binding RTX toxin-like protein
MATVFSKVFYKLAGKAVPGLDENGTALSTTGTDDLIIVQTAKDLGKDVLKDAIDGSTQSGAGLNYDELRIASEKAESYVLHAGITNVERVSINEDLCDVTNTTNGGYGDAATNIDASLVVSALTIIGNQGNNALIATALADTVYGGLGNDIITGGDAADVLNGGAGDDLFILKKFAEYATGEKVTGGAGTDKLVVDNDTANQTLIIEASSLSSIASIEIGTVDKAGKVSNKGNMALNVDGTNAGAISILGNAGNNTLTGSTSANTIDGDAGDDTLIGANGNDTFIGGAGKDTMTGGTGADTFNFVKTSDLVDGEKVNGGGTSADTDTLFLDGSGTYAFKVDADLLNVENVTMSTVGKSNTAAIGVDLSAQITETDFTVTGNAGTNKIVTSISTYANINGGAGNDTITTGDKNDIISGGEGNDVIVSGGGLVGDTHYGSTPSTITNGDDITGGAGDDRITSGSGNDIIDAGLGKDTIIAGAGNDTIYGAKGDDTIDGGTGDDIIIGDESSSNPGQSGNGADKLSGGLGNDTFVVEHVIWAKKDTIDGEGKGVVAATGDEDTLVFAECQTQASTSTSIFKVDAKLVKGIEKFVIDDDPFTTGESGTMPLGLDVSSYTTEISLKGNAGDNVLKTGTKDDILTGNAGADTITGGLGADKFVFNDTTSYDTITDFVSGTGKDKLVFSDAIFNLGTTNEGTGVADTYTPFASGIFEATTGSTFTTATARFGYDSTSGNLYYDADGSGGTATAVQVAALGAGKAPAEADLAFTA